MLELVLGPRVCTVGKFGLLSTFKNPVSSLLVYTFFRPASWLDPFKVEVLLNGTCFFLRFNSSISLLLWLFWT